MPKYSVRIIYGFNYVILLAFYFLMDEKRLWIRWCGILLSLIALLTTGTRTVILAPLVGICGYYIIYNYTIGYKKGMWKKHLGALCIVITVTVLVDFVGFQGRTLIRMTNSFQISKETLESQEYTTLVYDDHSYSKSNEIRGTVNSNTTRILEFRQIIDSLKKQPLFGYGFGSLGEIDDSSGQIEMDIQAIALLVKCGILGCLVWGGYFLYLIYEVVQEAKKGNVKSIKFLYLLLAIAFSCMLNITMQSYTMYILIYGYLETKHAENEYFKKE